MERKDVRLAIIVAIIEAILALFVGLILFQVEKDDMKQDVVNAIAGYFSDVEENMSLEQSLKIIYEDSIRQNNLIVELTNEKEQIQSKLDMLVEQTSLEDIITSSKTYADANEYINALAILKNVSIKTPEIEALIVDYEKKYESEVAINIDKLLMEKKYDEANDLIKEALNILPSSKILNTYKERISDNPQYLMSACPPYQKSDSQYYDTPDTFKMAGTVYTNGFLMQDESFAIFNLNGQYNELEFILGHIDETTMIDGVFNIYLDGKLFKRIEIGCDELPKHYTISLEGVSQMRVDKVDEATINYQAGEWYGFADVKLYK